MLTDAAVHNSKGGEAAVRLPDVLCQYKARGGETVVLGSDAHRYERIGKRFDFFKNVIKECGFDYIAHYRNMQPIYEKID